MEDAKLNHDNEEKFRDALDDFPVYDCEEIASDSVELNGGVSTSISYPEELHEHKTVVPESLCIRGPLSNSRDSGGNSVEFSRLNSSACEKNLENKILYQVELGHSLESGESSIVTDANSNIGYHLVRDELSLGENPEVQTSLLLTLGRITIKAISFQIDLLVKFFMFPLWLIYYLYMFVFDPVGFLKHEKGYLVQKTKRSWKLVFGNVSTFVHEWLKKRSLKCVSGLLWSGYVCAVLVGLLVSAFVMGGLLIRRMVDEPIRMKRSLNFDYRENSPVAFVPITAYSKLSHDTYLGEKNEIGMNAGSRAISPHHKLQVTVSLTLPESNYNQNLGIFQVRVDFLAIDGKPLASSRRPCMLQYKSQHVRLLLNFLKVAPVLTGYASETQNLKINFRGFTENDVPTVCLRVVIEQRAEFLPGAGIPEIYAAFLTLESGLPLLKKAIWFWKRPLFVLINMTIFTLELVFALICCKHIIFPTIRLREATNKCASQNARTGQN